MKRLVLAGLVALLTIALAVAAFAGLKSKMDLKAGDEIYACNCGEKCPCDTMSHNAGKCTCGKDMVKATVVKAGDGTATLKAEGWPTERSFKTSGQYACACGPACKCDTISQNPGKCTCGKDMEKVKAN
jgi:hypothetical protein